VYHEDPPNLEAVWRQKYRHGTGRYHIWPEPPSTEFLLDRYFLSPMLAKNDVDYVVPAHIAFLLGYRDARVRYGCDRPCWWGEFHDDLLRKIECAHYWSECVAKEISLRTAKMI
jgi:hypothetical protein